MTLTRKKLPIGISSLSKIIAGECYYADKTALLAQLIAKGSYYFLSRPRRFGKSLLLDTLKELFEPRYGGWACPNRQFTGFPARRADDAASMLPGGATTLGSWETSNWACSAFTK